MADNSERSGRLVGKENPGSFRPGQSGNPGGKNPERERLRKLILEAYGERAVQCIAEMAGMVDGMKPARSEKVRYDSLVWMAEQAIGKAVIAVSGPDGESLFGAASKETLEAIQELGKPREPVTDPAGD